MVLPVIIVSIILASLFGGSYYVGRQQTLTQISATPAPETQRPSVTRVPPRATPRSSPATTNGTAPTNRPAPTSAPAGQSNWDSVILTIQQAFLNQSFDQLRPLMEANIEHVILSSGCCEETGVDSAIAFIEGKAGDSTQSWIFDEGNPTINRIKSSDPSFEYHYIGLGRNGEVFLFAFNVQNRITSVSFAQHYRLITGSE